MRRWEALVRQSPNGGYIAPSVAGRADLSISCRRVLAFGLTAPAHIVAARARTVVILAHVCSFGLRPAFPLFLGVAIVAILYLEGGLRPAAFLLF